MFKYFIVLVFAFLVCYWIARKQKNSTNPNFREVNAKENHLTQILENYGTEDEITNDKIQALFGVSDATAERYLSDLEKQGRLKQIGGKGKYVSYKKL